MKIKFHYTLYVFLLLSYFCDLFLETLVMFIILILHELGHIVFLKKYKREIINITFFPFGGIIKHNTKYNVKIIEDLLISSGGIIVNIILMVIFHVFNMQLCFTLNLVIILFNIVPIYPLDGGKIVNYIINLICCYKVSMYISIFMSLSIIVLILISNILLFESMYLYLIILSLTNINIKRILSIKKEYKYFLTNKYLYPNKELKDKKIYRFKKPLNKIYLGKNNVYILDELQINEFDILKKHFKYL